jgi:hypothetical protein
MDRAELLEEMKKCGDNCISLGLILREAGYKVVIKENLGHKKETTEVLVYSGDGRLNFRNSGGESVMRGYIFERSSWEYIGSAWMGRPAKSRRKSDPMADFEPAFIMAFLDDHGKNKIKRLTHTHRHKLHEYAPEVRKTIAAYQLFMYGNKKDIHNPDIEVVFKVDIWFINSFPGTHKKVNTTRYTKCTVDLENDKIYREWKEGDEVHREIIQADNVDIIIDGIQKILERKEEK